jgi:hypothetical protein
VSSKYPFLARYQDLEKIQITLEGSWFKFIQGNGLYLSADKAFLNTDFVDLYSSDARLAPNNPPFYGIPVKNYNIVSNNIIEFYLSKELLGGSYDIIFCNPSGYVKASTKLLSSVFFVPGIFEYKTFNTISGNTLITINQNQTIQTIKIKFVADMVNANSFTINNEELATFTGDSIITLRKYLTL